MPVGYNALRKTVLLGTVRALFLFAVPIQRVIKHSSQRRKRWRISGKSLEYSHTESVSSLPQQLESRYDNTHDNPTATIQNIFGQFFERPLITPNSKQSTF